MSIDQVSHIRKVMAIVQVNLGEQVNDVEDHEKSVSREAVEKWLEDCRPKE